MSAAVTGSAVCTCGRKLAPVDLLKVATTVSTRTCRKCGARWQIRVTPRGDLTRGVKIHDLTLTLLAAIAAEERQS